MAEDCAVVYLSDLQEAAQVQQKLQSFGVRAELAETARALGVAIERQSPAFLVLDGPLAPSSGVEALTWLRQAGLDLPVVFLCASSYECDGLSPRTELRPYLACRELTREVLSKVLVRLRMEDEYDDMAMSGNLDEVDVTDLLLWALRRRWTGRVVLESGGISKTIFVDTGLPVYCSSNILSENFGRLLLKRGIISEEDYERARELQLKERVRQGEALIRLGVLKEEELAGYLRDQVEEKLLNAVAWSGGNYVLESGDAFRSNTTIQALNPLALLMEGERRFRSLREAAQRWPKLQPLWGVARQDRSDIASLVHSVVPKAVYQALEKPCKLGTIAAEQRWDPREAVAVFSVLERAGYLVLAERPEMLAGTDASASKEAAGAPAQRPTANVPMPPGDMTLPPGPPPDDTHNLLEELYETYFRTASANAYKLLGVDASAKPEAVIRARDDFLRRFSDERFRAILEEPKHAKALQRLRARITEAASGLLDPKRHQFSRGENSQTRTTREVSMKKLVRAEEEFQHGLVLLEADPRGALAHFSAAADLNPKDPLYLLYHGWSRYQCAATPGERTKAYGMIKRAVDANPIVAEGQLFLARVLHSEGRTPEAIERARTALAFEPDNKRAAAFLESLGASVKPGSKRI